MTQAQIWSKHEEALDAAQAWVEQNGIADVCKPKNFVQKVPLNKIYDVGGSGYLFLMPSNEVLSELRQQAAAINAKKLAKIAILEDQIQALKGSMIEPAQVEVEVTTSTVSEPVQHHGY
tara:strand:+ start:60 stop:416 length:357 start_codon:yes stop_codon:yes gene_type:complete